MRRVFGIKAAAKLEPEIRICRYICSSRGGKMLVWCNLSHGMTPPLSLVETRMPRESTTTTTRRVTLPFRLVWSQLIMFKGAGNEVHICCCRFMYFVFFLQVNMLILEAQASRFQTRIELSTMLAISSSKFVSKLSSWYKTYSSVIRPFINWRFEYCSTR